MKKIILLLAFITAIFSASTAEAMKGYIAAVNDYKIAVYVDDGLGNYTVADMMSVVVNFERGDVIYGIENGYAGQTWYNASKDTEFNVFVDDFWVDENGVIAFFSN